MRRPFLISLLIGLALFHAAVLLAGFISPYDFAGQNRDLAYAPPTPLHFTHSDGRWRLQPFVCREVERSDSSGYQEDLQHCSDIHFLTRGVPYQLGGVVHSNLHLFGVDSPARVFLMGTDAYGRDLFSRFLYGGQVSLFAGLLATLLSLVLGALLGTAAGFCGGWCDALTMRSSELFLALPWLYLLFAIRASLPLHMNSGEAFLLLISVIGAVGWARPARLIRGIVLSARERNYVLAARMFGASPSYIVQRHILPETYSVLLTQFVLLVPLNILAEVTLSFLGLGVNEPAPSWGNMLSSLQQYYVLVSYWWMILPAAALIPVFGGYILLTDELRVRAS